ncbi:MAG: DNA polymerase I [Planctomycetia bacterium]|nr:DNA polymerase I [Candidatus Brocadia sp.]QOJ05934.1 MAG: DNA polymerase I [Planctomycetia bacterium]TVL95940.1 MAG: DNA polymerase I [Candidatus Brocadia sp. BL1]HQU31100.1 DNA polymerase I [Candidatus Brocadia sapporoensis]
MSERFFIIDGHSQCYQAFYAITARLTTSEGTPVNAVYGFTRMLQKLLREHHPEYIAVVFDTKGITHRHSRYREYKANRKPTPDELQIQIPLIYKIVRAFNIPIYAAKGYEADDVIGTLVKLLSEKPVEVIIVTADKDMEQLLSPKVKILHAKKGKIIDQESLFTEKGIRPEQVVDVLALSGDASDNIPGVPGIGNKTALELIQKWGSLESVLANVSLVSGKKRQENLRSFADQARLSQKLLLLYRDILIPLDMNACKVNTAENTELKKLFRILGFHTLLTDVVATAKTEETRYQLVDTREKFHEFLDQLTTQRIFAIDLETTSKNPLMARIVGISFSWRAREAYYIPLMAPKGTAHLNDDTVLSKLRVVLEDENIRKIGQNIKYDLLVLRKNNIFLQGIVFDTMIASYLLNPGKRNHNLDDIAFEYLSYKTITTSEVIGSGREQITMDKADVAKVCEYGCQDADISFRLTDVMAPRLKENALSQLLQDIEIPLIYVLSEMEWNGICLDTHILKEMSDALTIKLQQIKKEIYALSGYEFNISSTRQLSEVLFEKLELPRLRRTKTGISTDANVLTTLAWHHTLPKLVLEYRQLMKLKNTYIDALPGMINPDTGRIHTSFNQTVTATGRLSSSEPNLQNIPIRTEMGRQIRRAFIPSGRDAVFLSADYSQIELRILAHFSGDEAMMAAFHQDKDIHSAVASAIYDVPIENVSSEMRRNAKAVNFGIVYGLSEFGLSRDTGLSLEKAREFIDAYFALYQGVKKFRDKVIEEAKVCGYVKTLFHRKRFIPDLHSEDKKRRNLSERIAVNTIIQGSAADLIKVAMNNIHTKLKKGVYGAKMLLQIHDELLFEVQKDTLTQTRSLVQEEMSHAVTLNVPIKVNIKTGINWMETE